MNFVLACNHVVQIVPSRIPRAVPPQPGYMSPWLVYAVAGMLPFGVVFVELHGLITTVHLDINAHSIGIMALVLVLLVLTCAEISIIWVYFQLCSEDHRSAHRVTSGLSQYDVCESKVFRCCSAVSSWPSPGAPADCCIMMPLCGHGSLSRTLSFFHCFEFWLVG